MGDDREPSVFPRDILCDYSHHYHDRGQRYGFVGQQLSNIIIGEMEMRKQLLWQTYRYLSNALGIYSIACQSH